MQNRRIGDTEVSAIGLGGMPMSLEGRPDEQRSVATIHARWRPVSPSSTRRTRTTSMPATPATTSR